MNSSHVHTTRSTRRSYLLIALAVAALVVGAAVFTVGDLGPPARLPITQRALGGERPLPPCSGLTGAERERCEIERQKRPGTYENGRDLGQADASANAARAVRGSGVEGVSSAGNTNAPGY